MMINPTQSRIQSLRGTGRQPQQFPAGPIKQRLMMPPAGGPPLAQPPPGGIDQWNAYRNLIPINSKGQWSGPQGQMMQQYFQKYGGGFDPEKLMSDPRIQKRLGQAQSYVSGMGGVGGMMGSMIDRLRNRRQGTNE